MAILNHKCIFCGAKTNFVDSGRAYCIDCYCKIRNSSHTHPGPNIPNVPISPMPLNPPSPGTYPGLGTIIC